ncbi:MAG: hypothetical protein EBS89_00245 [Proteobacteria bacterium]|nr:hypothetical protein [Pseudomonadota bacterium]
MVVLVAAVAMQVVVELEILRLFLHHKATMEDQVSYQDHLMLEAVVAAVQVQQVVMLLRQMEVLVVMELPLQFLVHL